MTEYVKKPKIQNFFEKLQQRVQKTTTLLCIGLDPHESQLPENSPEAAFDHCSKIINETNDFAAAFKPNIAFFEQHGAAGITVLLRIIQLIPVDIPIILDCKRGDIGTTAQAYAKSAFNVFGADAVTLSPYMGWNSVQPFVTGDFSHKGAFILCKTSNPSSNEVQERLLNENESIYEHVTRLCVQWSTPSDHPMTGGQSSSRCIGLVAGATDHSALQRIRSIAPDAWILCPGVGAQGGEVETVCSVGLRKDSSGLLVAVSRSISSKACLGPGAMAAEAQQLRDHINALRLARTSPPVDNTASSQVIVDAAGTSTAAVKGLVVAGAAVTEAVGGVSTATPAIETGATALDAVQVGGSVLETLAAGAGVIDAIGTAQTAVESLSTSTVVMDAVTTVAASVSSTTMLKPHQQEFITFALSNNSLQFGSFTLKSGRISPYFFNAGSFCSGRSLNALGRFYAQTLCEADVHFDVLFGPAYKGIPLATAVAMHWQQQMQGHPGVADDVKVAYNRKEAKTHGEGGELVGASVAGQRVVIIDDVITAGTAIRASVDLLRRAHANIVAVVVCLDRQERVSESSTLSAIQQVEEEFGFPVLSIVRLEHLAAYVATAAGSSSADTVLTAAIEAYRTRYGV